MRKRVLAFGEYPPYRCCRRVADRQQEYAEADHDSAAPTAATVVEVCKIWESHLRAVGVTVAATRGLLLHLCMRPTIIVVVTVGWRRWRCRGWGTIVLPVLVVMRGRWIGVDVPATVLVVDIVHYTFIGFCPACP
jgi:hypothetical protein